MRLFWVEPEPCAALIEPMTTEPPISPFKLTPQRTLILVLGILAIVFIIGGIVGGVGNYQALRESVPSSAASSSAG